MKRNCRGRNGVASANIADRGGPAKDGYHLSGLDDELERAFVAGAREVRDTTSQVARLVVLWSEEHARQASTLGQLFFKCPGDSPAQGT
jgi:hypothetical protein